MTGHVVPPGIRPPEWSYFVVPFIVVGVGGVQPTGVFADIAATIPWLIEVAIGQASVSNPPPLGILGTLGVSTFLFPIITSVVLSPIYFAIGLALIVAHTIRAMVVVIRW